MVEAVTRRSVTECDGVVTEFQDALSLPPLGETPIRDEGDGLLPKPPIGTTDTPGLTVDNPLVGELCKPLSPLSPLTPTRCPSCRAVTLDGHDPHPLTALGEALAWVANRPTATVVRTAHGWTLAPRTVAEIQAMPPGLCDVVPTHVCGAPRLPGLASAHAPRGHVTKASLLEAYGAPGGPRNCRPAKCRCGQWCLRGLDDDVMAFAHLADPWPVDPTYGRAIAGAAGRIVLNVTRKDGHSRFHHPWNPVPYSEQVFVSLPTHECGNGLPSIRMPTIEEVIAVNDPWNEDCECTF